MQQITLKNDLLLDAVTQHFIPIALMSSARSRSSMEAGPLQEIPVTSEKHCRDFQFNHSAEQIKPHNTTILCMSSDTWWTEFLLQNS